MLYASVGMILIAIAYFGYRVTTSGPRGACNKIAHALQIKPHLVDEMFSAMGPDRGSVFCKTLNSWPKEYLNDAVVTFFVFQALKNPHRKNVEWWRDRLRSQGFETELDIDDISGALLSFPTELTGDINPHDVQALTQG